MTDQARNEPHPLRSRLGGRNLYLVGMMGSGKSSSGRPLAQQLGYGFADADPVIEQAAGCTIAEIFERDGEAGFRALESQVLQAIGQRHSLVVATGGGVITKPENWGVLHQGLGSGSIPAKSDYWPASSKIPPSVLSSKPTIPPRPLMPCWRNACPFTARLISICR